MFILSRENRVILRSILQEYNIHAPKYLTQERLNTINWTIFREHNITIMELLQKHKEQNQNKNLATILAKELISEEPHERYSYKWNRNITLIID